MIGGLEETSRGKITLNGRDVTDEPPAKRGLSMVFQSYALYPHMSVRENMGFSLKTAGKNKEETRKKVEEQLKIQQELNKEVELPTYMTLDETTRNTLFVEFLNKDPRTSKYFK